MFLVFPEVQFKEHADAAADALKELDAGSFATPWLLEQERCCDLFEHDGCNLGLGRCPGGKDPVCGAGTERHGVAQFVEECNPLCQGAGRASQKTDIVWHMQGGRVSCDASLMQ